MDKSLLRKVAILHPSHVMQPYDTLLEMCGFDALYEFTQQLGGLSIYVPLTRKVFSKCLEIEARKEFTGDNYSALAKKYGYADRHMRRILGIY